ncbi:endonuclease/exonuclease/phosphatase family protein [Sneathia sanguinegens]|uniref:endonuclease/exonuclease/phosphatase family protein n=1 Tax=Sneathia sanguinegens TaxID=40543 RepID=UPI00288BC599|nr:endonuclease/exonuclease/phosphatase family protein [Sneathia sanguinegens]
MKKLIIIIAIFFECICFSKRITLASFNVERLGESKKDYVSLAKIVSKFDIIALEEVMNTDGLDKLLKHLNNYSYIISKPVGSKKYKEHYAILYKKNVVDKIENIGVYNDKNNDFIREPLAFYVKTNKLDMLLIPVHSIFGKNESERVYEATKYIDVYNYFYNKTKQDDIILLGDFNLPANDKAFNRLKRKYNLENIINPIEDKTTLSKKGLASSYDNIFINISKLKAFTNRYGVYNFTMNNYEKIRKYISDHLLIFIELENERD